MAYTSFFRDPDALTAISEIVIPELSHRREIRVWDAGCASGEEPYTLAMLFADRLGPFTFGNLDILATDQEESNFPQFEQRIKEAVYSRKDIFWVPQDLRDRYFMPTDDPELFRVIPDLRRKVRFIKHDLLSCQAPEDHISLIVCKNVLMHFKPEEQVPVLTMFYNSLQPDGFLVLDGNQNVPSALSEMFIRNKPGVPLYRKQIQLVSCE
jgi:chemotaxis protein methyltransferase CheR